MSEALALSVEHDVDGAFLIEIDVLGSMTRDATKSEPVQQFGERGALAVADRKFDELDRVDARRLRQRRKIVQRRIAALGLGDQGERLLRLIESAGLDVAARQTSQCRAMLKRRRRSNISR